MGDVAAAQTALTTGRRPVMAVGLFCALLMLIGNSQAQRFQVIHTFYNFSDGFNPTAGLSIDSSRNLYGTTRDGGYLQGSCQPYGCGTVFKLSETAGGWAIEHLHAFRANEDGAYPYAGVVIGSDDNLYGTTFSGGTVPSELHGNCGYGSNGCLGTVYELVQPPSDCRSCSWTENVIHRFHGDDGFGPAYGLVSDLAGNLYSTTWYGGHQGGFCGTTGCGVAFELARSGDTWTETVLHEFTGCDGIMPSSSFIFDANGNAYGETLYVDPGGYQCIGIYGLAYELLPGGGWHESVLYDFGEGGVSAYPNGGFVFDSEGNLYGVGNPPGTGGNVFEFVKSGTGWTANLIYSLRGDGGPVGPLARDTDGNLYGITVFDGAYGNGNVFKLTPTDQGWVYTSLHDFTGLTDGRYPSGPILLGNDGNLYGTTANGGDTLTCNPPLGCGAVWEITPR